MIHCWLKYIFWFLESQNYIVGKVKNILILKYQLEWFKIYWQEEIEKYNKICEEAFIHKKDHKKGEWLDSPWDNFFKKEGPGQERWMMVKPNTAVPEEKLNHIGMKVSSEPEDVTIHSGKRNSV